MARKSRIDRAKELIDDKRNAVQTAHDSAKALALAKLDAELQLLDELEAEISAVKDDSETMEGSE